MTWTDGAPSLANAPKSAKTVGIGKGVEMALSADGKSVNYGDGKTIEYFADIAEDGKVGS